MLGNEKETRPISKVTGDGKNNMKRRWLPPLGALWFLADLGSSLLLLPFSWISLRLSPLLVFFSLLKFVQTLVSLWFLPCRMTKLASSSWLTLVVLILDWHLNLFATALQFVLGGQASLFAVVEVEEKNFKFMVYSKSVGLEVYSLNSFSNSSFRVLFHL